MRKFRFLIDLFFLIVLFACFYFALWGYAIITGTY